MGEAEWEEKKVNSWDVAECTVYRKKNEWREEGKLDEDGQKRKPYRVR